MKLQRTACLLLFFILHGQVHLQLLTSLTGESSDLNNGVSCPDGTRCLRTSGCHLPRGSTRSLFTPLRYSLEHVNGLLREFRHNLWESVDVAAGTKNEWSEFGQNLPVNERGLLHLYPTRANTSVLTEALLDGHDRILRELRWWITSLELQVQTLHSVNLLRWEVSHALKHRVRRLSRGLNLLLEVFSISPSDLPGQTVCAEFNSVLTDDGTRKAQYTSVAIRDVHRSLVRMYDVLALCEARSHDTGRHRVRLHCGELGASAFYANVPSDIRFLYHHSDFLAPDNW